MFDHVSDDRECFVFYMADAKQDHGEERIYQTELWIVKDCDLIFLDTIASMCFENHHVGWDYI